MLLMFATRRKKQDTKAIHFIRTYFDVPHMHNFIHRDNTSNAEEKPSEESNLLKRFERRPQKIINLKAFVGNDFCKSEKKSIPTTFPQH